MAPEMDLVTAVELTPERCSSLIKRCVSKHGSGAVTSHLLPSPAEMSIDKLKLCQLPPHH